MAIFGVGYDFIWQALIFYPDMVQVVLTSAFVRHYPGTIFELDDTEVSLHLKNLQVQEKVNPEIDAHFFLPDDGLGRAVNLPYRFTRAIPGGILRDYDLLAGPCRVTFVSLGLEVSENDPWHTRPMPSGKGKIQLSSSSYYTRNQAILNLKIVSGQVTNRQTHTITPLDKITIAPGKLDFSSLMPGFYTIDLKLENGSDEYFTLFKCFPVYVREPTDYSVFKLEKSLW